MPSMLPAAAGINDASCRLGPGTSLMTRHLAGGRDMSTTTENISLATLSGSYTLDPAHSRIGFVARHAMVTKVRGAFNEFTGSAVLDGEHPENSTATVTIKAESIDTRNA